MFTAGVRQIVLRTHGGLGNQIFQVLFGRLLAQQCDAELLELHDDRYKHRFARAAELGKSAGNPSSFQALCSALRLPKILTHAGIQDHEMVRIGSTIYADGYFQQRESYSRLNIRPSAVEQQIRCIRRELGIEPEGEKCQLLVHLRVGDFFASRSEARAHVMERLEEMPVGATFMTNDDALLDEPEILRKLDKLQCVRLRTENCSPVEVLQLMCGFRKIRANDSTLTFWAGVLGEVDVTFRDPDLLETFNYFCECCRDGSPEE